MATSFARRRLLIASSFLHSDSRTSARSAQRMLRFCPYIPVFRDLLARDKRQEPNPQELEHLHNLLSYRKHSYIPPQFQSASQLNLIMPSIKREVLPPDHCKRTQAPFQSKSGSADMDCSLSIMQFLCHIPQAQNGISSHFPANRNITYLRIFVLSDQYTCTFTKGKRLL